MLKCWRAQSHPGHQTYTSLLITPTNHRSTLLESIAQVRAQDWMKQASSDRAVVFRLHMKGLAEQSSHLRVRQASGNGRAMADWTGCKHGQRYRVSNAPSLA